MSYSRNLDALWAVEQVFTTPMVLAALLGRTPLTFAAHPDRARAGVWHFRFARRSVLSIDVDGTWTWLRCADAIRLQVEPLIEQAQHAVRESRQWRGLLRDHGDVITPWMADNEANQNDRSDGADVEIGDHDQRHTVD